MHVSASDIDLSRHVAGIRIPIKLVLFIYLFIYDMNMFYLPGIPFVADYNWRPCIYTSLLQREIRKLNICSDSCLCLSRLAAARAEGK